MERLNIKKVIKKLERYEIVSFDIFDTLIKRNLSEPKSLFDFIEKEYNKSHFEGKILDFRSIRSEAEKAARNSHPLKEITLDEIYSFLQVPDDVKNELKRLEIGLELKFCEPNYDLFYIYDRCRKLNKRIIIVSDMYLPKEVIGKMLSKCGIDGYEKLYLSSEIGLQKKDGRLYDFVLRDLGIKSGKIVHFGDRKKIDYLVPRLKGIHSIYVPHFYRYTEFLTGIDLKETKSSLIPFINNQLPKYKKAGEVFRWGYEALGPILIGYCNWIHKMVIRYNIDTLVFLARDMYMFEKIYRQIYGDEKKKIVYLEVSRKSLRNAYVLKKGTLRAVFDTLPRKPYTICEVLNSVNVSADEIPRKFRNHIITNEVIYSDGKYAEWFDELDKYVIPTIIRKENNTCKYLEQMGLMGIDKKAVIDIGWHGTIQNILETICDVKTTGLYLGIRKRINYGNMKVFGYWFKLKNELDSSKLLSSSFLLETMIFSHIGSTKAYKLIDDEVVPEYEEKEVTDYTVIKQFQNGAKRFVKDFVSYFGKNVDIKNFDAMRAFIRLVFEPEKEQIKLFSGLQYEDGDIENMVETKKLRHYMLHPKDLKSDYKASRWKEGYIKQVLPWIINPHCFNEALKKFKQKIERI